MIVLADNLYVKIRSNWFLTQKPRKYLVTTLSPLISAAPFTTWEKLPARLPPMICWGIFFRSFVSVMKLSWPQTSVRT